MKAKAIIPREQSNRDVDEAAAYYLCEAGEAVAMGFVDALEKAYGQIGRNPGRVLRATPMNSICRVCTLGR